LNTQLAFGQPIDLSQHVQAVGAMVRVAMADQAQDPSSVLLAFIGREDVAEDLGANRFDGDSVRSSREQQGLLLVSRFVGQFGDDVAHIVGLGAEGEHLSP
jgi:hypothetical protein